MQLEVGGAALRALRLEAMRYDAETGRYGDTERKAETKVFCSFLLTHPLLLDSSSLPEGHDG